MNPLSPHTLLSIRPPLNTLYYQYTPLNTRFQHTLLSIHILSTHSIINTPPSQHTLSTHSIINTPPSLHTPSQHTLLSTHHPLNTRFQHTTLSTHHPLNTPPSQHTRQANEGQIHESVSLAYDGLLCTSIDRYRSFATPTIGCYPNHRLILQPSFAAPFATRTIGCFTDRGHDHYTLHR